MSYVSANTAYNDKIIYHDHSAKTMGDSWHR